MGGEPRIVDGDGLATVDKGAYEYQAPGIPGDLDGDGDVTLADLGLWLDCLKGPGQPVPSGGLAADIDGDADVDLLDFALFCGLVSE